MFVSISREIWTSGGEENLLPIQVNVCYILEHLENRKCSYLSILVGHYYSHFQTAQKNSASALFFCKQFENLNVTPV